MICKTFKAGRTNRETGAALTVYIRDTSERFAVKTRPLVLVCPGGAYAYTSVREGEPVALAFLGRGYHAALLNYSCAPAQFPDALCELAESITLIRQHAGEWNIDPERIVITGFSAGGHLAGSLGCFWNTDWLEEKTGIQRSLYRPDRLILAYPVITSGKYTHRETIENLLGTEKDDPKLWNLVSLENQVTEDFPETFIWSTEEDELVPVQNSLLLVSSLVNRGIPVEYHLFRKGLHGLALGDWSTRSAVKKEDQPASAKWLDLADSWIRAWSIR